MRVRLAPIVFVLLSVVAGCAASKDQILSSALAGANAAEKAFIAYDRAHQDAIVETATSRADGEHALEAYRAQRVKVTVAMTVAYGAIAAASTDGTDASLRSAIKAVASLVAALQELGVIPIPGGKS